ncbi:MAG: hypothetical protein CME43_03500 [Haliea sp.]|uniref:DUF2970 domain-containing protein n=1 Tax=Haliea sp. TaxID=1932666 RepID=UPI000C395785|nr:DUF2970 domain-containing protein [Haliea sp.]MBM68526.1 hypothetical protein [Haliea sp.]|tara:strand:- start:63208 stop:63456 length:249 start_codon:yes stop_codon:yes gene_type:complete
MSEPAETRQAPPGESKHKAPLRPWQVISSVFAAGLGVQSSRNRERDFSQGRIGVFIAAGLIFTILFIIAVVAVVHIVISSAG